jgi:hypothetical protein
MAFLSWNGPGKADAGSDIQPVIPAFVAFADRDFTAKIS